MKSSKCINAWFTQTPITQKIPIIAGKVRSYHVNARITMVHQIERNTLETMTIAYLTLLNWTISTKIINTNQIIIALPRSVELCVCEAISHQLVFCNPSGKGLFLITWSIARVISLKAALLVLSAWMEIFLLPSSLVIAFISGSNCFLLIIWSKVTLPIFVWSIGKSVDKKALTDKASLPKSENSLSSPH